METDIGFITNVSTLEDLINLTVYINLSVRSPPWTESNGSIGSERSLFLNLDKSRTNIVLDMFLNCTTSEFKEECFFWSLPYSSFGSTIECSE